mmetsp:Transcript_7505/g.21414  ORF Transcript_7505/g.21414 Transcript_7505/m.21414 type:complete len:264 (+) Transcript_7505:400-1191(+)
MGRQDLKNCCWRSSASSPAKCRRAKYTWLRKTRLRSWDHSPMEGRSSSCSVNTRRRFGSVLTLLSMAWTKCTVSMNCRVAASFCAKCILLGLTLKLSSEKKPDNIAACLSAPASPNLLCEPARLGSVVMNAKRSSRRLYSHTSSITSRGTCPAWGEPAGKGPKKKPRLASVMACRSPPVAWSTCPMIMSASSSDSGCITRGSPFAPVVSKCSSNSMVARPSPQPFPFKAKRQRKVPLPQGCTEGTPPTGPGKGPPMSCGLPSE